MKYVTILRHKLYRQLDPEAWTGKGLSPLNWTIFIIIWLSIIFGVLATEPTFSGLFDGWLLRLDRIILGFFALEYILRLATAGLNPKNRGAFGLLKYLFRPVNVADLIVILPIFLSTPPTWTMVFRLARIFRLLRLATLPHIHQAIREFAEALTAKLYELTLTLCLAIVLILVSSTTLFLLERNLQPEIFGSIPRAVWWSVITFTTVGYGDAVPISAAGRFCAGAFAILGVGLVAMLTGVIASALNEAAEVHTRNRSNQKDSDSSP